MAVCALVGLRNKQEDQIFESLLQKFSGLSEAQDLSTLWSYQPFGTFHFSDFLHSQACVWE